MLFFSEQLNANDVPPAELLSKKGKILESDLVEPSSNQGKIGPEKNGLPSTSEKDVVQSKTRTSMVKSRQSQSGPLMPGGMLTHSISERARNLERLIITIHIYFTLAFFIYVVLHGF